MKLGLQIPSFTFPGGPQELGPKLTEIGKAAEDAGFDSVWVPDHFFQVPVVGPAEHHMLEAYTTLGYLAGRTSRVSIGTMVTGVTFRNPGILVKQVTTLDVLSGGRAWFGIGAAWFEREHEGLGIDFPSLKERFERLEEALQIAHQMWDPDNNGRYDGKHYQLAETLNIPPSLSRPRPRILIGGSGEKKTLRLVAKYGDACNIFAMQTVDFARQIFVMQSIDFVRQRLNVLRGHCEREGRNYDDIEKTVLIAFNVGPNGEDAGRLVEQLKDLSDAGAQTVIGAVIGVQDITPVEAIGRDVIPHIRGL
jgi:F420-dependent oxidoreductase-like protein